MPEILLITEINSTAQICFDLARSIDLHLISTAQTGEKAIAGRTSGLIGPGEWVTWEATHFGIQQQLTSQITVFEPPFYFVDEQLKGPFKSLRHEHRFEPFNNIILMHDRFCFQSPFGFAGRLFNTFVLTNYMRKLLMRRNEVIRVFAEGEGGGIL